MVFRLSPRSARSALHAAVVLTTLTFNLHAFAQDAAPAEPPPAAPETPAEPPPAAPDTTAEPTPAAPETPATETPAVDDAALAPEPALDDSFSAEGDLGGLEDLLGESVVVAASQSAESTRDAPGMVTVVRGDDIRRFGARTVSEALNYLGLGLNVARTPNAVGQRFSSRGLGDDGNHILVMLDGHVINDQGNGLAYLDERIGIPIEMVESIELILGPGSVLYGSNAMYGVVNIVTRRAGTASRVEVTGDLGTGLPGDGNGDGATLGQYGRINAVGSSGFKLFGVDAGATLGISYLHIGQPSVYYAPQDANGARLDPSTLPAQRSYSLGSDGAFGGHVDSYSRTPSAYGTFTFGRFRLMVQASQTTRHVPGLDSDINGDGTIVDRALRFDARHSAVLSESVSLSSRLYGALSANPLEATVTTPPTCPVYLQTNGGCAIDIESNSRWVGLEEQVSIDWNVDGEIVTLVGVDGRMAEADGHNLVLLGADLDNPLKVTFNEYQQQRALLGVYAQQIWHISPLISMNAGARLDVVQDVGSRVSPRAALIYTPADRSTVKLSYAEGFRAPTVSELSNADPASLVRNPNLSPEIVRGVDLVFEQKFTGGRVLAGGFAAFYDDIIAQGPADPAAAADAVDHAELIPSAVDSAQQLQNQNGYSTYGTNVELEWNATDQLTFASAIVLAYARESTPSGDVRIAEAPTVAGNLRAAYNIDGSGHTLALASSLLSPRSSQPIGPNALRIDSPTQVRVRGTVSGPLAGSLSYFVTAEGVAGNQTPNAVGPGATLAETDPVFAPEVALSAYLGLRLCLE